MAKRASIDNRNDDPKEDLLMSGAMKERRVQIGAPIKIELL